MIAKARSARNHEPVKYQVSAGPTINRDATIATAITAAFSEDQFSSLSLRDKGFG